MSIVITLTAFVIGLALGPTWIWAGQSSLPYVFQNGQIADAGEVNANFDYLASQTDTNTQAIQALGGGGAETLRPRFAQRSVPYDPKPGGGACSSHAECPTDFLCNAVAPDPDGSCHLTFPLVDYNGSGVLYSITVSTSFVVVAITLDDDEPQVFARPLLHGPSSLSHPITFGSGLRFEQQLRIDLVQSGGEVSVVYAVN